MIVEVTLPPDNNDFIESFVVRLMFALVTILVGIAVADKLWIPRGRGLHFSDAAPSPPTCSVWKREDGTYAAANCPFDLVNKEPAK